MTATETAKACGLGRVQTYRYLDRLQRRGFVETTLERPMRFAPLKPSLLFSLLAEAAEARVAEFRAAQRQFDVLETSSEQPPKPDRLRIVQGRNELRGTVFRLINGARREILIMSSKVGLWRLYHSDVETALRRKRREGVAIRILAPLDASNQEAVEQFGKSALLRHLETESVSQFLVVDAELAMLTTSGQSETEALTGLLTSSKEHIALLSTLFQEIWQRSPDAKQVLEAVASGKPLPRTEVVGADQRNLEARLHLIQTAQTFAYLLLPSAAIPDYLRAPVQPVLQRVSSRGVKLRAITYASKSASTRLPELTKVAEIRILDENLDMETLICDSGIFLGGDGTPGFWSSQPAYVKTLRCMAELVWNQARPVDELTTHLQTQSLAEQVLNELTRVLTERAWEAAALGKLTGASGIMHEFSLVARDNQERLIGFQLLLDEKPIGPPVVAPLGIKARDARLSRLLLVVHPKLSEAADRLAAMFGFEVLPAEDVAARVRQSFARPELAVPPARS